MRHSGRVSVHKVGEDECKDKVKTFSKMHILTPVFIPPTLLFLWDCMLANPFVSGSAYDALGITNSREKQGVCSCVYNVYIKRSAYPPLLHVLEKSRMYTTCF